MYRLRLPKYKLIREPGVPLGRRDGRVTEHLLEGHKASPLFEPLTPKRVPELVNVERLMIPFLDHRLLRIRRSSLRL